MAVLASTCGGLLVINGLGISIDVLSDSPFTRFTVPGVILETMVGGRMTIAAVLAWMKHRYSGAVGLVDGVILLG